MPIPVWYVPAAHTAHTEASAPVWYRPAVHSLHADCLAPADDPAGHGAQSSLAVAPAALKNRPAAHAAHAAESRAPMPVT
jgi:hypothetical protein